MINTSELRGPVREGETSVVLAAGGGRRAEPRFCLQVFDRDAAWRFPLGDDDGELLVGRGEGTALRLTDGSVSRAHARLEIAEGRVRIVDLASANGVVVNGERITGARELLPRDIIALGRSTLVFMVPRVDGAAPLPYAELAARVAAVLAAGGPVALALLSFARAPSPQVAERAAQATAVAWTPQGELLALLPAAGDEDEARTAAARLVDSLEEPLGQAAAFASAPGDGADLETLLAALRAALASGDPARTTRGTVRHVPVGDRHIVVADPLTVRVYDLLALLAPASLSVLIGGETGVGKEAAARYLHLASPRASGPFVALSCASLPAGLVESELFGHEKGAFSGATSAKPGLFELGDGGTVFLDEVGELSPAMQAKILRVLDTKRSRRIGDLHERAVDIRVVSATNRDLAAEVKAGRFRQDLYFRLSAAHVHVPPLRERPRELAALARDFLAEACARAGRTPLRLSTSASVALAAHPWPGNVRELRNLAEYLVAAVDGEVVEAAHLPPSFTIASSPTGELDPLPRGVQQEMRGLEKRRILDALQACGGNQSRAAALIKMPRRTFVAKLRQYNIRRS